MTRVEPTTMDELSARVLAIIGTYRMGAPLDAHDLHRKPTRTEAPPETGTPRHEGYVEDGIYHAAE